MQDKVQSSQPLTRVENVPVLMLESFLSIYPPGQTGGAVWEATPHLNPSEFLMLIPFITSRTHLKVLIKQTCFPKVLAGEGRAHILTTHVSVLVDLGGGPAAGSAHQILEPPLLEQISIYI